MTRTVSIIGAGRIGRDVIDFVNSAPDLMLGRVLTRNGNFDTSDPQDFFATPADQIIDAAGPAAIRMFGRDALSRANLWTVGAAALADDHFRDEIGRAERQHSTRLRLFSPWIAGIGHGPQDAATSLTIRMTRPGIGTAWSGPLREAVKTWPDDLNSAVAAALCGPGIDRTRVEMLDAGPDGGHDFHAELITGFGKFVSRAEFTNPTTGLHPTAAALIGGLRELSGHFRYG